jgi:hypothetical protein
MRHASLIACLSLALAAPAAAPAQDAAKDTSAKAAMKDTLPFHKGQWGAEFAAGTTFASAGVLYFRSPSSAWLLDATFVLDYGKSSVSSSDTLYPSLSSTTSDGSIALRAGIRSYHPIGHETQFFTTLGGLVRYSAGADRGDLSGNDWTGGLGAFGEIGGNYMINPHIGVGATAGVNLTYNHQEQKVNGFTNVSDFVSLSGALFALRLGIYF